MIRIDARSSKSATCGHIVYGDQVVVYVGGELDHTTVPGVRDGLFGTIMDGYPSVLVDLREVTFCDSSGVQMLLLGLRRAQEAGGSLALVEVPAHIRRMLSVTGLDEVFSVAAAPRRSVTSAS